MLCSVFHCSSIKKELWLNSYAILIIDLLDIDEYAGQNCTHNGVTRVAGEKWGSHCLKYHCVRGNVKIMREGKYRNLFTSFRKYYSRINLTLSVNHPLFSNPRQSHYLLSDFSVYKHVFPSTNTFSRYPILSGEFSDEIHS